MTGVITRRSALVGALSSLFIPPAAIALIQPAIADQAPMTAMERADFHMAEFAKAMDEMLPVSAHSWGASLGGSRDDFWHKRFVQYRFTDPDASSRLGREVMVERLAEFR